jgi:DNA-binding beta-propeller fold protein YncE
VRSCGGVRRSLGRSRRRRNGGPDRPSHEPGHAPDYAGTTAAGAGAVWVVNYKAGTISRIDPRALRVRSARVGASPFDVIVAYGRVWVTAWEDGLLVEVDPGSYGCSGASRSGRSPWG